MNKKKAKTWSNVKFETWKYEDQTRIKHQVFGYYLSLWLQILGTWNGNLNFVDGFGGIGAYHTDDDIKKSKYCSNNFGSPIISMQAISKLEEKGKIRRANILIMDKEKNCINNVKKIVESQEIKIKGSTIYKIGTFNKEINEFLDDIDKEGYDLAPTFFLLDPFGYADIRMKTIERIMSRKKTEILLTFMYDALQRWAVSSDPETKKRFDEYFGGKSWEAYKEEGSQKKEEGMVKIFKNKCNKFCDYVYPFKVNYPYKKRTFYYLFHLTKHYKGCWKMKDSFAKFNDGKTEYNGEGRQSSLFQSIEEKEKKEKFIEIITKHYNRGEQVKYFKILEKFISKTDLLEKEIRKLLQEEENNKIIIKAGDKRKRKSGINENDIIYFK